MFGETGETRRVFVFNESFLINDGAFLEKCQDLRQLKSVRRHECVLNVQSNVVMLIAYLEPDFDLSLGQVEQVCDLYPSPAGQVVVVVELLLELQRLEATVGLATATPRTAAGP